MITESLIAALLLTFDRCLPGKCVIRHILILTTNFVPNS